VNSLEQLDYILRRILPKKRQNLTWRHNTVNTRIRTQVPVNRFQIHVPEVQAVFPIDQIVRQGSIPVEFVRGDFCARERHKWYFDYAPTYQEWLFKQEQIPRFYVVTHERQANPQNQQNWQDHALPRWLYKISTFRRSPTGL
jgi:hypothetical protein